MQEYLKDSLYNFSSYYARKTVNGTFNFNDYKSIRYDIIDKYVDQCDSSWFGKTKILPNTNIEKVSQDLYDDPNYWDMILILNHMSPLFGVPFDFDVINDLVNTKLDEYEKNIYGKKLPEDIRDTLYSQYEEECVIENNECLTLKYVVKEHLYDFLSGLYELNVFSTDMNQNTEEK